MKIIQSKSYKKAQNLGIGQGQQSDDDKIKELISQGMNVGRAIRAVYPDLLPLQVEELKNYYAKRI